MNNPIPGQAVGIVTRKEFITPHYIRIYFSIENIDQFKNCTIGVNNKIAVPPKGLNEIHFPGYDPQKHEWIYPAKEVAPAIRTYTHRGIDLEKEELIIDFVYHGDSGPASQWAYEAVTGSKLGIMMRPESKELYPEAKWYMLAGDATAIPVIAAILETLPKEVKATCIIEVHSKEDEQILNTHAEVDFLWLHNSSPEKGSELAKNVREIKIPEITSKFAYVAAEFSSVKEIRNYIRKELRWQQNELYAYSYWKAGVSEDKSQSDRRRENIAD